MLKIDQNIDWQYLAADELRQKIITSAFGISSPKPLSFTAISAKKINDD